MNTKNTKKDLQNAQILNLDDDFSLVKRFIDGDESAFAVLVQRHKEKIRNIIYLTMNNSNSVDDIAQDVFLTVYRNLNNFRFESQFTTWLYRLTVHVAMKARRRQVRSPGCGSSRRTTALPRSFHVAAAPRPTTAAAPATWTRRSLTGPSRSDGRRRAAPSTSPRRPPRRRRRARPRRSG